MFRTCLRAFFLTVLYAASAAAEPPVTLYCARGTPDYPDAHMTLNARDGHVVNVVFVGYRPSPGRAAWSLRDCLNTATKLDGSRDIVAWLWYRDRERPGVREPLQPHTLVYKAASRTVVAERSSAFR
jgi:hypothetical protein